MSKKIQDNLDKIMTLHVIVRHRNERTLPLVRSILRSSNHVFPAEVSRDSFVSTLKESFSLALNYSEKWVVMLDADVVPSMFLLTKLVAKAHLLPTNCFVIVPNIYDKSFMKVRKAGVHIYNRQFIPLLLEKTRILTDQARPETFVINQMKNDGYLYHSSNLVVGLHDFDQYYKDLWLKGFVFARKSQYWVKKQIEYWREKSKHDLDYRVLMDGYSKGLNEQAMITTSRNLLSYSVAENALHELGIQEKNDISTNALPLAYALKIFSKNMHQKPLRELLDGFPTA